MFDKKLENNSKKSAEHYNQEAAQVLNDWLTCAWKKEEPHLKQFDWVVVLNPNPHETKQNMSFRDAYQKESWFFDNLFAPMGTHWSADGTPTAKPQPQLQPGPEPSSHQPLPEPEPEPSSHQPQTEPESQAGDETPRTLAVINPRRLCGIDGFRSALIRAAPLVPPGRGTKVLTKDGSAVHSKASHARRWRGARMPRSPARL
jgi:hypothetical protein